MKVSDIFVELYIVAAISICSYTDTNPWSLHMGLAFGELESRLLNFCSGVVVIATDAGGGSAAHQVDVHSILCSFLLAASSLSRHAFLFSDLPSYV